MQVFSGGNQDLPCSPDFGQAQKYFISLIDWLDNFTLAPEDQEAV